MCPTVFLLVVCDPVCTLMSFFGGLLNILALVARGESQCVDSKHFLLFCPSGLSRSSVCRTTPPCSSAPTNWIRRTSSESQTPSWSFTEATRMARESHFCLSALFLNQCVGGGQHQSGNRD